MQAQGGFRCFKPPFDLDLEMAEPAH